MLSFSAISSIAISRAIMPVASPGARMALPSARSSTASRICINRLAPAYISRVECGGRFGSPAGQIPRPAFVPNGGNGSVGRSANSNALNGRRAMDRVIGDQRSGQGYFHRSTGGPGRQRSRDNVGQGGALTPKSPTNIGSRSVEYFPEEYPEWWPRREHPS